MSKNIQNNLLKALTAYSWSLLLPIEHIECLPATQSGMMGDQISDQERETMCKKIDVWMLVSILSILSIGVGTVNGWVIVYSEDFSTDPGWTTDDPAKLRWDSVTGTFHGTQVNTEGTIAYKIISGFDPQQSWRLEFDSRINSCDWSAGWDFGLFDDQMQYPYSAGVLQGIADGGRGTNHNSPFVNPGSIYNPAWSKGIWYTHLLEYDAVSGVLSLTVRERNTGDLFMERSLVTPALPSDLTYLGVSRRHMKNTVPGASPTATVDYNLDNIVLSVPEPAMLSLLVLGGWSMIRRRR